MISLVKIFLLCGVILSTLSSVNAMTEAYMAEYRQQVVITKALNKTQEYLGVLRAAIYSNQPIAPEMFCQIEGIMSELKEKPLSKEQKSSISSFPFERNVNEQCLVDIALLRLDRELLFFLMNNFDITPENILFILLGHTPNSTTFNQAIIMFSQMLHCSRLDLIKRLVLYGVYFIDLPFIIEHLNAQYHDNNEEALELVRLLSLLATLDDAWHHVYRNVSESNSYNLYSLKELLGTVSAKKYLANMRNKYTGETLLERMVNQPINPTTLNSHLDAIRYLVYDVGINTKPLLYEIKNARINVDRRIENILARLDSAIHG